MKKFKTQSGESPGLSRNTSLLMQDMHNEVKANITIIPELEALIPPLQPGEYEQLEANIIKEGCRESLLIWQINKGVIDGTDDETTLNVLIDGHNRYSICTRNNLQFKFSLREFTTYQEAKDFMIDNQLGRRNLSKEQMSYLRGLKYRNEMKTVGRLKKGSEAELPTHNRLAQEYNVSPSTIQRDKAFSVGVDQLTPELKKGVLSGKQKIKKEVIQEIGKTAREEGPKLSLPEVEAIAELIEAKQPVKPDDESIVSHSQQPSSTPGPETTPDNVHTIIEQIILIASSLDPDSADFKQMCDELIELLANAKKSAYNI